MRDHHSKRMSEQLVMPCGTTLDLKRPRSEGVLSDAELAYCRQNGISLAYDPLQIGWVPANCDDDMDFPSVNTRAGWPEVTNARSGVAHEPQMNALRPQYRLRAWEPGDLADYIRLLDDPEVWTYLPEAYPDPLTEDLASALIELSNASNHHQVFAVLRNAEIVGQVRLLFDVDDKNPGVAEISYWLGRAHWGKGIGGDIVGLFTKRCFADNPALTSIIAQVHRDNAGSRALLRKCGYMDAGSAPGNADIQILRLTRADHTV